MPLRKQCVKSSRYRFFCFTWGGLNHINFEVHPKSFMPDFLGALHFIILLLDCSLKFNF